MATNKRYPRFYSQYSSPDFHGIVEATKKVKEEKKKMLDKMRERAYNILIKGKAGFLPLKYTSINLKRSQIAETGIKAFGQIALKDIPPLFEGRKPIVAGGAIRDMALGVLPKDYDIFIPCKGMDPAEVEDLLVMALLEGEAEEVRKVGDYSHHDRTENTRNLIVYESNDGQVQYIADMNAENPLDIINGFDYNLVMGYYSPSEECFSYSPLMMEGLKKNEIVPNPALGDSADNSCYRARKWLTRHMTVALPSFSFPMNPQPAKLKKGVGVVAKPLKWRALEARGWEALAPREEERAAVDRAWEELDPLGD